jgi:hypothetical protein
MNDLTLAPADFEPKMLVPAYFHPVERPQLWAAMADNPDKVGIVILNVANGPGHERDGVWLEAVEPLLSAGIDVVGYVDTGYGRRPRHEVVADIGCYLLWYQVTGILFDQVATAPDHVESVGRLARHARDLGARLVVFNHGAYPAEGYAEHADILGTFEGSWKAYVDLSVPVWTRRLPERKAYHVVHSVPLGRFADAALLARSRRAGYVYVTDRDGPNPYDRLPAVPPTAWLG